MKRVVGTSRWHATSSRGPRLGVVSNDANARQWRFQTTTGKHPDSKKGRLFVESKSRVNTMWSLLDVALHSPPVVEVKVPSLQSAHSASTSPAPPTVSMQQVMEFYAQDKHAEVLLLWEMLKHKAPTLLTTELLAYFVESAEMERRPQLVITMVEFAQSCGVAVTDSTSLRFVQACHWLAVDRADATAWHKATGMLEVRRR